MKTSQAKLIGNICITILNYGTHEHLISLDQGTSFEAAAATDGIHGTAAAGARTTGKDLRGTPEEAQSEVERGGHCQAAGVVRSVCRNDNDAAIYL